MAIFIILFLVPIFSLGDAETQNKFLKCVKVVKLAVKMCQILHYNGFFRLRFFVKKRHGGYTLWSAIDFTVKARL